MPLTLTDVRFRMDHEVNYGSNEPIMKIISTKGYVTTGFLRGTDLAVGQIVQAQSTDGHLWTGWITAQGLPDWTDTTAWFFVLFAKRQPPGEGVGDGVTVTVTVTDPNDTTQTATLPADPPPQISDVP
jgi:hypothetical protein